MISFPLWIGSGSPAGIERAAFVGSDAPGLAKPCAQFAADLSRPSKARACSWRAGRGPASCRRYPYAKPRGNLLRRRYRDQDSQTSGSRVVAVVLDMRPPMSVIGLKVGIGLARSFRANQR
jgi:hypothetical protein